MAGAAPRTEADVASLREELAALQDLNAALHARLVAVQGQRAGGGSTMASGAGAGAGACPLPASLTHRLAAATQ